MNEHALWHKAKSEFSYAYDQNTLHLVLRTKKNDVTKAHVLFGDPFQWQDDNGTYAWVKDTKSLDKRYSNTLYDYYFIALHPPFYRTKYIFILSSGKDTYAYGSRRLFLVDDIKPFYQQFDLSDFYNFPYINDEDLHQTPLWVKDTVWYQIFPDRFFNKDNETNHTWGHLPVKNDEFYGGNIKGIIEKLPYLKDLGINGIYFTPIFESPSAHKYDTTDYFKIDPQFGTNDDFKEMVKIAHENGIKVMLDGVFNHAGFYHPFFQDVILNGEKSLFKDCFYIKRFPIINFDVSDIKKRHQLKPGDLNYATFAFAPYMPKWRTDHPLVKKHLLDCVRYWIESFDIDGWRLDVSNEISHTFLRDIKTVSREAKKDVFILGENWDNSTPWLLGDQMDSVMNYELAFPIWKYLEHDIDLNTFKELMVNYMALTPKNVMENMFNLVGSHDTMRIKRRFEDDPRRVKLAYLLLFLSSGAPTIYYGDEIGLTGAQDPDNRRCMLWDPKDHDKDFYRFMKTLITLRTRDPLFKDYDFNFIDSTLLAFTKGRNQDLLVIINNQKTDVNVQENTFAGNYLDLITNKPITLYDKIQLKAYQFLLLKRM